MGDPSKNEKVISRIIDSLGHNIWCEKSPYSLMGVDYYVSSWEQFCNTVKHRVRYFFDSDVEPDRYSGTTPARRLLDELRDINDGAGLIRSLPAGTRLFRVRPHRHDETCDTWRSLGSPPPEVSVSNRMSAAGISVFYAAMDMATARAEVAANLLPIDSRVITGATWTNLQPLNVLDLTRLPPIPSVYARARHERDPLIFLREFVESITQPVVHDGREHTEYVPSQVVTEYFRHRYRLPDGSPLDGIVYPSTQRKGGKSIVVFAAQQDLDPQPYEWEKRIPVLTMDPLSVRRLRRPRRSAD